MQCCSPASTTPCLPGNATAKAWSDFQPNMGFQEHLGPAKPDITLRVYAHLVRNDDGKAAAINEALARQVPIGCQFRGSLSSSPPLST